MTINQPAAAFTLANRAMLAELSIKSWNGRRRDKEATDEIHQQKHAARDAGAYQKALVSREALAGVQEAMSAARAAHYALTLPWSDSGPRILSAAAYIDYMGNMEKHKDAFDAAAAAFATNYDAVVREARGRLGQLFKAEEYPPAAEIAQRFAFKVEISPMPTAEDFRADVTDEAAEIIRADMERRANERLQSAMREAWQRIAERVGAMADKLAAYQPAAGKGDRAQGIFRDSLVDNIRDLVATLPALNVTNDPKLAEIAGRLERELCTLSAADLRTNDAARADTAQAAAVILAEVQSFLA